MSNTTSGALIPVCEPSSQFVSPDRGGKTLGRLLGVGACCGQFSFFPSSTLFLSKDFPAHSLDNQAGCCRIIKGRGARESLWDVHSEGREHGAPSCRERQRWVPPGWVTQPGTG